MVPPGFGGRTEFACGLWRAPMLVPARCLAADQTGDARGGARTSNQDWPVTDAELGRHS